MVIAFKDLQFMTHVRADSPQEVGKISLVHYISLF